MLWSASSTERIEGDETGTTKEDQIGRARAPRGQTPVVVRRARRISQSMISRSTTAA